MIQKVNNSLNILHFFMFTKNMNKTIYQFTVNNLQGKKVDLAKYKGKVVLIVNTASKCGFTPQYATLEKLYQQYKDKGFEILAFPSNDFGQQEPLDHDGIENFCQVNYGVSFPMMEKTIVKGEEASDLYKFLSDKSLNGNVTSKPKWNFHKYLVNKNGEVVDYFFSTTSPTGRKIPKLINKLLAE